METTGEESKMGEKVIGVRIAEAKAEHKLQVSLPEVEIPVVRGKVGRPRGKYSDPQKPYVVSMRISDDEMLRIQEMMRATNKGASELMRAAFQLFKSEVIFNQTASAA